jgi:hypothetical protein
MASVHGQHTGTPFCVWRCAAPWRFGTCAIFFDASSTPFFRPARPSFVGPFTSRSRGLRFRLSRPACPVSPPVPGSSVHGGGLDPVPRPLPHPVPFSGSVQGVRRSPSQVLWAFSRVRGCPRRDERLRRFLVVVESRESVFHRNRIRAIFERKLRVQGMIRILIIFRAPHVCRGCGR